MSPNSQQLSDYGGANSPPPLRFLARLIAALVRPPSHSRTVSIALVLGISGAISSTYVAVNGTVTMQVFYLVPIICAVSWLGLGWGVFISLLTAVLRMAGDFAMNVLNPDFYFAGADLSRMVSNRVSSLSLFLVVVLIIHELIVLSRQLEQRVQARTDALRQAVAARDRLQQGLFEAGARERSAIGRDLHDGLGQHLTATAMAARVLATRLASRNDPLATDARGVETLIKSSIDQTRHIARGLLLESVKPNELCSELEELAEIASQHHRIPCILTAEGSAEQLNVNTASHLFYIAREALRNAMRHSAATKVAIHIAVQRTFAEISVVDNGRGISTDAPSETGMGLQIMTQRAEFMGGTLRIHSPTEGGTRVDCRVPLNAVAVG